MSTKLCVTANAKLTRTLRVVGRREDGYHLLSSEMVALDLVDDLEIDTTGSGLEVLDEISWSGDSRWRPRLQVPTDGSNLVERALALLEQQAAVRLIKRIPPGAGLGGGSSDAAAVLRAFGFHNPVAAASLGADVPFCLFGGRAQVSGVGEVLAPLPDEDLAFVVVTPGYGVSTADVYRAYDELGSSRRGDNDLELAALAVEPRLSKLKAAISATTGAVPTLAGSGSSYFLECGRSRSQAIAAELLGELAAEYGPILVRACAATRRQT